MYSELELEDLRRKEWEVKEVEDRLYINGHWEDSHTHYVVESNGEEVCTVPEYSYLADPSEIAELISKVPEYVRLLHDFCAIGNGKETWTNLTQEEMLTLLRLRAKAIQLLPPSRNKETP